jgi:tetratricopeptide (TPR) repeat protein
MNTRKEENANLKALWSEDALGAYQPGFHYSRTIFPKAILSSKFMEIWIGKDEYATLQKQPSETDVQSCVTFIHEVVHQLQDILTGYGCSVSLAVRQYCRYFLLDVIQKIQEDNVFIPLLSEHIYKKNKNPKIDVSAFRAHLSYVRQFLEIIGESIGVAFDPSDKHVQTISGYSPKVFGQYYPFSPREIVEGMAMVMTNDYIRHNFDAAYTFDMKVYPILYRLALNLYELSVLPHFPLMVADSQPPLFLALCDLALHIPPPSDIGSLVASGKYSRQSFVPAYRFNFALAAAREVNAGFSSETTWDDTQYELFTERICQRAGLLPPREATVRWLSFLEKLQKENSWDFVIDLQIRGMKKRLECPGLMVTRSLFEILDLLQIPLIYSTTLGPQWLSLIPASNTNIEKIIQQKDRLWASVILRLFFYSMMDQMVKHEFLVCPFPEETLRCSRKRQECFQKIDPSDDYYRDENCWLNIYCNRFLKVPLERIRYFRASSKMPNQLQTRKKSTIGNDFDRYIAESTYLKAKEDEFLGLYEIAFESLQEAQKLYEKIADIRSVGTVLNDIGNLQWKFENPSLARTYYEQSLALREQIGDDEGKSITLFNMGQLEESEGKYQQAIDLYNKCVVLFERTGNRRNLALSLYNAAKANRMLNDPTEAQELFEKSLSINRELEELEGIASCLAQLFDIALSKHEYDKARRIGDECLAIYRKTGDEKTLTKVLFDIGTICQLQQKYDEASEKYHESLALCQRLGMKMETAYALYGLANLDYHYERYEDALEKYQASIEIYKELKSDRETLITLVELGRVYSAKRAYVDAISHLRQSVALSYSLGLPDGQAAIDVLNSIRQEIGEQQFGVYWKGAGGLERNTIVISLVVYNIPSGRNCVMISKEICIDKPIALLILDFLAFLGLPLVTRNGLMVRYEVFYSQWDKSTGDYKEERMLSGDDTPAKIGMKPGDALVISPKASANP